MSYSYKHPTPHMGIQKTVSISKLVKNQSNFQMIFLDETCSNTNLWENHNISHIIHQIQKEPVKTNGLDQKMKTIKPMISINGKHKKN